MKVLFIQKMAGISGSELYLLKILPLLHQQGVECMFLSLTETKDLADSERFKGMIERAGIPYKRIEVTSLLSLKLLKEINRIYTEGNFDLIHTHLVHADFWAAAAKFLLNRKIKIVSSKHGYEEAFQARHGFDPAKKELNTYYLTALFAEKFINRSAAISDGLRNFYIGMGISKPEKIDTVLYGLDFSKEVAALAPANCRFYDKQLLIVGRLIPYKGQRMVIECMPELVKKYPDVGLVLVGRGTSMDDLKELVENIGMQKYVRFEGLKTNVHAYFQQSDIVLVPSKSEGFGIIILEAWYHSKPVIAYDVSAPNTIIRHNQTGLLVKPFDLEELKSRISELLESPEKQKQLGQSGKHDLNTTFSEQRMAAQTISLYKKVLSEN